MSDSESTTFSRNELDQLVANMTNIQRTLLARQVGAATDTRDLKKECHHVDPRILSAEQYREKYDTFGIATRVVDLLPEECWGLNPEVYEVEAEDEETEFEAAWKGIADNLQTENFIQDEESSPVWEYLKRVDKLSGIGQFGVLLLGLGIEGDLREPLPGFDDDGNLFGLAFNEKRRPGKQVPLIYLRAFDQSLVRINTYETRANHQRYNQPITYNLTLSDPHIFQEGIGTESGKEVEVHWSRLIHVADNLVASENLGRPRMQNVYNHILDLEKLYGGSAEMYWQGAFPGISFETHPQLGNTIRFDAEKMKDMVFQYFEGLQRYLATTGATAKTLSPQVSDPTNQIERSLDAICITIGVAKRIFMGTERGELASSQDKDTWEDRLMDRRTTHINPRIIAPFINRLIQVNCLPKPKKGAHIKWGKAKVPTPVEQAGLAAQRMQAVSAYIQSGADILIPPQHFLVRELGYDREEAEEVLKEAAEIEEEKIAEEEQKAKEFQATQPPVPGQVPGQTPIPGQTPKKAGPPQGQFPPKAKGTAGKVTPPPKVNTANNCGIGSDGFQSGNTCAKGGGEVKISKPKKPNDSFEDEKLFTVEGGQLWLAKSKYSPADWSVVETFVDEDKRRQGIASKLIESAKQNVKGTIGAQCSNRKSVNLFWKHGFRNETNNLNEALKDQEEDSSVYLEYNPDINATANSQPDDNPFGLEWDEYGDWRLVSNQEAKEAKTEGRKLNRPFRTPEGPKKFAVYTKNDKGKVVIVRFGDPDMKIKRDDPQRRANFRSRHSCDDNPGPKWKARYWACKTWTKTPVSKIVNSEGVWRTTDGGSKIFIKGGEVRAGGPSGPRLKTDSGTADKKNIKSFKTLSDRRKASDEFYNSLTDKEKESVFNYSGIGTDINLAMRSGQLTGWLAREVPVLTNIVETKGVELPPGTTVYRTVENSVFNKFYKDQTSTEKGFLSTSASKEAHEQVIQEAIDNDMEDLVSMVITATDSVKTLPLQGRWNENFGEQDEFAIQPGVRLKHTKSKGNVHYFEMSPSKGQTANSLTTNKIVKVGENRWRVVSSKGKNLGTFGNRKAAKKRLQQVEYFKQVANFDPNQPRAEDGKWTDGGIPKKREFKYDKGHFDKQPDPRGLTEDHVAYSPVFTWVQEHDSLLRDAIVSWKGSTTSMGLHIRDILEGKPIPDSGSGKIMRAQAEALLDEVMNRPIPAPTLYRGDNKPPSENSSELLGWTSDRKVAQKWARKYKGKVYKLEGAKGIPLEGTPGVGNTFDEKEWVVAHNIPQTVNFDPNQPRDEDGKWSDGSSSDEIVEDPKGFASDNRIVDKSGKPIRVFHGTSEKFDEFKDGVTYFSPNPGYSYVWKSPHVMEAEIYMRNPYHTEAISDVEGAGYWPDFIEELKSKGYDGIVYSSKKNLLKGASGWGNDHPQYVVFSKDQIRQLNSYTNEEFQTGIQLGDILVTNKKDFHANAFCPTGEGGGRDNSCPPKKTGAKSVKALRAKKFAVRVASEVQRYSEEFNEPHFAKLVGGESLPNNEPIDIRVEIDGRLHGIELKTMTIGKNNKLTMKKDAMDRKAAWERKNKGRLHTVVYDDTKVFNAKGSGKHDINKRRIFYRRGYGSFRVENMYEVQSEQELRGLLNLKINQIPASAGGTKKGT
jgi:hypothetical protein